MKTYFYITLLTFFIGFNSFSQNLTNPGEENMLNEKIEFGNFMPANLPFRNFQKSEPNREIPVGNQIFIEQIGANNKIDAYTSQKIVIWNCFSMEIQTIFPL